jgi:hypothetical protein
MDAEVSLREFGSEVEAEIAAAALRANGIRAETRPGSGIPANLRTTLAGPTVVLVSAEDVERANEILDTPADLPSPDNSTAGEQ